MEISLKMKKLNAKKNKTLELWLNFTNQMKNYTGNKGASVVPSQPKHLFV